MEKAVRQAPAARDPAPAREPAAQPEAAQSAGPAVAGALTAGTAPLSRQLELLLTKGHAFVPGATHQKVFASPEPAASWGSWMEYPHVKTPVDQAEQRLVDARREPARDKADKADQAGGGGGLFTLAKGLGAPAEQWVQLCAPDYAIWRYRVLDADGVRRHVATADHPVSASELAAESLLEVTEDTSLAGRTQASLAARPGAARGLGALKARVEKSRSFNAGPLQAGDSARDTKTTTAGGAWLASQVDSKEKIGSVENYMGKADEEGSAQSKHLKQFLGGGHAFITGWVHKQIHNLNEDGSGWGGWGQDANFLAPLSEANALVKEAAGPKGRGIFHLEEKLGIPAGSWVNGCKPDYKIWRYIVKDPKKLNLRIPSGNEKGAYSSWWRGDAYQAGQWAPGGHTEGGAAEAVIDKISIDDLKKLGSDVLELKEDDSMAANTKKVLSEQAAKGAG